MKQLVICVLLSILLCLVGSNNSSELSAIGEALIWLRDNLEETKHYTDVVINYDSEYAAKSITGEFNGLKNQNLYLNIRKILEQLRNERSSLQISFKHVKGHSNDPWNDLADKLANRGSSGETCKSGRYAFSKGNGVKRRREETVL
jgi:ribonuclease HI